MKNIQEIITRLEGLKNMCHTMASMESAEAGWKGWQESSEALDAAVSMLRDADFNQSGKWTPIESGLPDENIDVQVTVQDVESDGDVYRSIDCIIDNGDGPLWAEHHGAWDRVLAWAPMLPAYMPDDRREE